MNKTMSPDDSSAFGTHYLAQLYVTTFWTGLFRL